MCACNCLRINSMADIFQGHPISFLLFALGLISPIRPTGSRYACLYFSGKFLTSGDAAAKQEVYEPGSGHMKNYYNSSMTVLERNDQGVLWSLNVFISPGCMGMDSISILSLSNRFCSSRAKRTQASLVMPWVQ